jgi:hypothetical protein
MAATMPSVPFALRRLPRLNAKSNSIPGNWRTSVIGSASLKSGKTESLFFSTHPRRCQVRHKRTDALAEESKGRDDDTLRRLVNAITSSLNVNGHRSLNRWGDLQI